MTTAAPARERPSSFAAVASFLRISALGVTLVVPFLGAASAATDLLLQGRAIIALVVVAISFHIFGFVINDLVDLPIDRTAGRESSPLVRGTVRPVVALGMALAQIPIALAMAWWGAGRPGVVALLVAGVLGTAYNVWGKRTAVPPAIDLVQGLAWAAFAGFGVAVAGGPGPATGWLLAFLTVYMMLASGVHGGIRDLRNDASHGARTTVLFLEAQAGPDRTLLLSRRVIAYALVLQGLLTGLSVAAAFANDGAPIVKVASVGLVIALAVASFAWLGAALRRVEEDRLRSAGIVHLILTFLLPLTFLIPTTPGWLIAVVLACCTVPFLLNGWLREAARSG